jgi:hypothetical protein
MASHTTSARGILRQAGRLGPWVTLLLLAALVPFCMGSGCYVPLAPTPQAVAVYDDDRSKEEVEQELADLRQRYADAKENRRQASENNAPFWEYDMWNDRCEDLQDRIIHNENVLKVWFGKPAGRDVARTAATSASRPAGTPAGTHVPTTGACRCPPGR